MADLIVCKFGGSSVANAGQIEKVKNIVQADARRRIVVVSAPERSESGEQKITDHLINIATDGRLLSCKGFNVFHLNAMLPCKEGNIPIHIRNTNKPRDPGTAILFERVPEEGVVGIARLDNVAYIYLEKEMLGEEVGFTADLLTVFRAFGIHTYHYPIDKDDIAVLVSQDDLTGTINDLRRRIEQQLKPDFMDVAYNLCILTPVGLGLRGNSYPIVDALSALGEAHIPIEMIDQSPSQICFHIGVQQAVADDALRILYRTLIG